MRKNPEKYAQYGREYAKANRDRKTANRRAWRNANSERDFRNRKNWADRNREKIRAADRARYDPEQQRVDNARWYQQNKDKAIAQATQWRLDNPELARIKGVRDTARRRARKLLLPVGPWTEQEVIERDGLVCWIKGCPVGGVSGNGRRDWAIDHLIPLSRDFPDHPGDVLENLAIACSKCNIAKAAKILPQAVSRYRANVRRSVVGEVG